MESAVPHQYRQKLQKIGENIQRLLKAPDYYLNKLKVQPIAKLTAASNMSLMLLQVSETSGGELDPQVEAYENLVRAAPTATVAQRRDVGYSVDDLVKYCSFGQRVCDFAK